MKSLTILLVAFCLCPSAHAFEVFNLNVFDQLQGDWKPDFRAQRMKLVADFVKKEKPDLVVFQEAQGDTKAKKDSADSILLRKLYPHRQYIHEMTGKDNASYGYWMGAKRKPKQWIEDGFSFEGGVARRVQAAVFDKVDGACVGVLSLHLSYQTSGVRVKEAHWLLDWLKRHESVCGRWLVVGDFNAGETDAEMKVLFEGGLRPLFAQNKPTVGAFNPIRQIYGADTPARTIDWALGWKLDGQAAVVLDSAVKGAWVSDHAAVTVKLVPHKK